MGKVKKIEITLDNPNAEYIAGQVVTGNVILELSEPVETRGVFVKFYGDASTSITEVNCLLTFGTTTHYSTVTYFNERLCLHGDSESKTRHAMEAGEYSFPFRFVLPLNSPSTFKGKHGRIKYRCVAVIELAWKLDPFCKKKFVVHALYDLNNVPTARQSVAEQGTKYLCCLCCKSGPISAVVRLQRTGFIPGEYICINAEITNLSRRPIRETKAILKQKMCFHAKNKTKKEAKEIAKTKKGPIEPGETGYWDAETIEVPNSLVPTNLGNCELIDVKYVLEFTAVPDAAALVLTVKIPITIGTTTFYTEGDTQDHPPIFYLPQTSIEGASVVNAGFV